MRKLAVVVVATMTTLGTVGATIATAGASVPAASKFCNALKKIDTDDIGNPSSETGAAKTAKQLKKVQKAAKGNTKKAVREIVEAYEAVADGESAREAFGNTDFARALGTFGLAASKCVLDDLPDLPDITIPSIG